MDENKQAPFTALSPTPMEPSSPFTAQLYTNYVPTSAEAEQIRNDIILPAESEILQLDAQVDDLHRHRDILAERVASHKSLVSLPRRLAPEIIRHIFLECLPDAGDAVMSPTCAPLKLGRICGTWRTIALQTQELWSCIHISLGFLRADERRLDALEEWLQRSQLPLSLTIVGNHPPNGREDGALIPRMMNILLGSSHRWHRLELSNFNDPCIERLADADAPMLEIVTLRDEFENIPDFNILHGTRLTEVTLLASLLSFQPAIFVCPAAETLRHLSLSATSPTTFGLRPDVFLDALKRHSQLVSLVIQIDHRDGWSGHDVVHLPHLESFRMINTFTCDISLIVAMLSLLILPDLVHFDMPPTTFAQADYPLFNDFFTRTTKLRSISLYLASFTDYALVETLKLIPTITSLSVVATIEGSPPPPTNAAHPDSLLTMLSRPSEPLVCPALTSFEILDCPTLSEGVLMSFLRARIVPEQHCFRSLRVGFLRAAPIIRPDLGFLNSTGVEVELIFEPGVSASHGYREA
ncbi:hypothetical protein R3P38DRAFT_2882621 [Favolaschia claudopus]|uniref:F-box domain-containing protein n=1 Tax=Favolaschia claudopus TaxID=2862362 RepID=A0AAW0D3C3_9AGAR